MTPDRLVERLQRGDRIRLRAPAAVVTVSEVVQTLDKDQPEGTVEVRFRYEDGRADWTFARPLDRVQLA